MKWSTLLDWIWITGASIGTRLIPLLIYGLYPLGYDTGFYRRYAAQELISLPRNVSAGVGANALIPRLLLDALAICGISTDTAIYGTLIGGFTGAAAILYHAIKKRSGRKAGLIGATIFIFSGTQYAGYWFFLMKNYIAICIMLLIFNELEKITDQGKEGKKRAYREYIPLLAYTALMFYTHMTTSMVLIGSMAVYMGITGYKSIRKGDIIPIALLMMGTVMFLIQSGIWQKIDWQTTAIFMTGKEYIAMAFPLMLVGIGVMITTKKKIVADPLASLLLITGLLTLIQGPFYERMFLFMDIAIIGICAKRYNEIEKKIIESTDKVRVVTIVVIAILTGWYMGNFIRAIKKYTPLITKIEVVEMKRINELTEKEATILTTSDYMPWVYGFTTRRVIAPGLLEYTYDLRDWERFWFEMNEREREKFLMKLPQPLYLFTAPGSEETFLTECIQEKTGYLKKFSCQIT